MADDKIEENELEELSEIEEIEETAQTKDEDEEAQSYQEDEALDEVQEDVQEYDVQKKLSKIQKILIGTVAALFIIILIGVILYFMGMFDPEPTVKPTPQEKQTTTQVVKKKDIYEFKAAHINDKRLNRKLSLLTKYELVIPDIDTKVKPEPQKEEKKEELVKTPVAVDELQEKKQEVSTDQNEVEIVRSETQEELEPIKPAAQDVTEEKSTAQEDLPKDPKDDTVTHEDTVEESTQDATKEHIKAQPVYEGEVFLKFIQVATLKYKLYKEFLNQVKAIDARISICAYKGNKTQIFIGPFNEDEKRDSLIQKINSSVVKDAFKIEFTQEEFNKRCNF
ncbi:MAG: hypothetical protein U9N30_03145 [Campylobacterota bacterium]|nr:hypothetical protein [Campylobacterota bacterium]